MWAGLSGRLLESRHTHRTATTRSRHDRHQPPGVDPHITAEIHRLVQFPELVTGSDTRWATDQFTELRWPAFTPAIGSTARLALSGDDVAHAAANRSVIVEFEIDDVNAEYDRLSAADPAVVVAQPPTAMPWGNHSLLLRASDGTLVELFTTPPAGRHVPVAE